MQTAARPKQIEVVAVVDNDDDSYEGLKMHGLKIIKTKRTIMSDYWNIAYRAAKGPIYMLCGDDIVFKTRGWDNRVKERFEHYPDRIVMVYGNDGTKVGTTYATHPFLHENWIKALGYFTPPYFSANFCDTWLNELAKSIGRHDYLNILTEHRHHYFQKAMNDQTYQDNEARDRRDNNRAKYESMAAERQKDITKLKKALKSPPVKPQSRKYRWSILVLTIPGREAFLKRLLEVLEPQIAKYDDIELIINPIATVAVDKKRNASLEMSSGKYVNFIDDDDMVPGDYVEKIHKHLDGKNDIIGFKLRYSLNGTVQKPSYHSLKYKGWTEDKKGFYRDITHLNPIKREFAVLAKFNGRMDEDAQWSAAVVKTGKVKKEHFINEFMYDYNCLTYNPARRSR